MRLSTVTMLCWFWMAAWPVTGATPEEAPASESEVRKGMLGSVEVDSRRRTLSMSGWVNMNEGGPVEYLICGPRGKTHESVFVVEGSVTDLHAAFLLLGVQPGQGPMDVGRGQPVGPECVIWVEWEADGEQRRERAEKFILDLRTGEPLPDTGWVFTGSIMREGRYMATLDESYVATYWDPWAVLNIPLDVGADDTLLLVNKEATPEEGTPVRIFFELPPPSPPPAE